MMATTMQEIPTRDQIAVEDTWDLTTMFADDAAWERSAEEIPALVEVATAYEGRLADGPVVVAEALQTIDALHLRLYTTIVYASLRRDEDTADPAGNARYERAVALSIHAGQALAFVQPELLAIPEDAFFELVNAEELATYRHMFDDLNRQRAHVRSQEVEEILAQMSDVTRTPSDVFGALDNADLRYGNVTDAAGNEVELTKGRYALLQESQDRDVRKASYEALNAAYGGHVNSIAAMYGGSVRGDVVGARIRGYESARAQALFDDNVPEAVYDTLVEVARDHVSLVGRYLDLRRDALGLDDLKPWDLRVPLAPESSRHYDYREAVEIVLTGVEALGAEYVRDLRVGFDSRWVDVHETRGKRSGAYSFGAYGSPPVMLMNWNGTLSDVFTLAHEAGHAMHTFYANRAQPFHLAGYPIFLAEIASTVNEVLLTWALLGREEAQDPIQRFALLNRFVDSFQGTVFRQTMFAEFEQGTHALAEQGVPLTAETFSDLYGDLHAAYIPGVAVDDVVKRGWARIPHFYRAFYVYQYATGMSAAVNIARAVRDEGEPAQRRYLEMLAAGGSDYPMVLLQRAGVDLSSRAAFEVAMEEVQAVIAEMERLAADGVVQRAAEQAARSIKP